MNDPSLLSLMGELREALTDGQIDIEVEPVMDLMGGRLIAAEALVRWHHPTRGTLRPDAFLPLAERNGLIVPLTDLVLNRAVAACAAWRSAGLNVGISVNLSARSLLDRTLPGAVADVLRRYRLPAHLLTLEITESIVISDADRAIGLLAELRALGVRLALDDFGTGYSSLTYLSALPIQQLKIDRSFVTRITESGSRRGDRHLAHRPRAPPGPAGHRRGDRGAGRSRPAAPPGLRVRPGLLLLDVDGAGGVARVGCLRATDGTAGHAARAGQRAAPLISFSAQA